MRDAQIGSTVDRLSSGLSFDKQIDIMPHLQHTKNHFGRRSVSKRNCEEILSNKIINVNKDPTYANYRNSTGPGDYDLPELTGQKSYISKQKNAPSFTFGDRGKDNFDNNIPSFTKYNPKYIRKAAPKFSFNNEQRFATQRMSETVR